MNTMRLMHLSANDASGVVVNVHKSIGDAVAIGDLVAEIETTKAVIEVTSTIAGSVTYVVPPASRVRVGDRLLEVRAQAADAPRASAPGASAPRPVIDDSLRRRMSDDALALVEASGPDIIGALPATGLITTRVVNSILERNRDADRPSRGPPPVDLETYLAARSNEKFCTHLASHPVAYREDISEDLLACGIAAKAREFLALLVQTPGSGRFSASPSRFSISVVIDLNGIPALVEIDRQALHSVRTIAEAKLDKILQLRRQGGAASFATRSIFAISTLRASHVSHHFPIVPENHAAVFGLLIGRLGCSITLGYDHRRLSGFNAVRMLDLAVLLLAAPE